MNLFEYKVSQRNRVMGSVTMNEFGKEGWELISVITLEDGLYPFVYTFKREKQ